MQIQSQNDIELECIDCHDRFVWTEKEQEFYKTNGYTQPKRCRPCRAKKRQRRAKEGLERKG